MDCYKIQLSLLLLHLNAFMYTSMVSRGIVKNKSCFLFQFDYENRIRKSCFFLTSWSRNSAGAVTSHHHHHRHYYPSPGKMTSSVHSCSSAACTAPRHQPSPQKIRSHVDKKPSSIPHMIK